MLAFYWNNVKQLSAFFLQQRAGIFVGNRAVSPLSQFGSLVLAQFARQEQLLAVRRCELLRLARRFLRPRSAPRLQRFTFRVLGVVGRGPQHDSVRGDGDRSRGQRLGLLGRLLLRRRRYHLQLSVDALARWLGKRNLRGNCGGLGPALNLFEPFGVDLVQNVLKNFLVVCLFQILILRLVVIALAIIVVRALGTRSTLQQFGRLRIAASRCGQNFGAGPRISLLWNIGFLLSS